MIPAASSLSSSTSIAPLMEKGTYRALQNFGIIPDLTNSLALKSTIVPDSALKMAE